MHLHALDKWQHEHDFMVVNEQGEQRTRYVLILTALTMVVEIIAGTTFGSMALLADGWHMGTHVAAFLITIFAYQYARKHANNPAYAFGTGKVSVLGGFASAVALAVVALMMLIESIVRIVEPHAIQFNEAISVAFIGLVVNIISAWLLKDHHHHHGHSHEYNHSHAQIDSNEHEHTHQHDHSGHEHHHEEHHDHNLKAAYMHVIADALTSLLAIFALLIGKFYGLYWMDPMMGIVGGIIITRWSIGLLKETGPILLDASIDSDYKQRIIETIESDSDNRITDVHIWKVGAHHYAAIISLMTHEPKPVEYYQNLLQDFQKLSHTTIEVNVCQEAECIE